MLVDRVTKETTDYTRVDMDMTWWLDAGEMLTTVVASQISLGTTGWSEAPYPPPGAPPPYDPTPLLFKSVTIDTDGTGLTTFVEFGTPGNVYTCTFVLDGSSTRRVTIELGVQISGEPPVQPLPAPVLPPPQGVLALPITGGVLQGPLYLFEDPQYPTEAATKAYVDAHVGVGGVESFNTRVGTVTLNNADVIAVLPGSGSLPLMNGAAAAGGGTAWSRADHVHPADTSRYAASNPSGYQTAAQVAASLPLASSLLPLMNGAAAAGSGTAWSRADHVHPVDTSRYAASNPSSYVNATQAAAAARVGTTTNDNAAAGMVGEYISSNVPFTPGVALADDAIVNVTSISLTAGDWDVSGAVSANPTGTTTIKALWGWVSLTSAALPAVGSNGNGAFVVITGFAGLQAAPQQLPTGTTRLSLAAPTTVYLCVYSDFANAATMAVGGFIGARRAR